MSNYKHIRPYCIIYGLSQPAVIALVTISMCGWLRSRCKNAANHIIYVVFSVYHWFRGSLLWPPRPLVDRQPRTSFSDLTVMKRWTNEVSSERKDGKTASLDLNYGGMSLECSTRVELAAHLTVSTHNFVAICSIASFQKHALILLLVNNQLVQILQVKCVRGLATFSLHLWDVLQSFQSESIFCSK